MAWRIERAVIRGEIDNTVEGLTTGTIWLAGCDTPLQLRLVGDCWRDLAGTRLLFENADPEPCPEIASLARNQTGVVGDMTASRKCRVPTMDEMELDDLHDPRAPIPCEWHNALYLEWFGEFNGRVVIETVDFLLTIFPHEWEMDEDAEAAQQLANLNAMRDFMALVIQRGDEGAAGAETSGELDEFAWEARLKESDRLTDAYQEVLEKYCDDEDSERKEAFVMGWDGLLQAMAEADEMDSDDDGDFADDFEHFDDFDDEEEADASGGADSSGGWHETADPDDDPDQPGDWHRGPAERDGEGPPQLLQTTARDLARRAMELADADGGPGSPSYELVSNLLEVSGKLASVLCGPDECHPEVGYVLAILKRCMSWLNQALHACQALHQSAATPQRRKAFEHIRDSIFQLRNGIVEIRMKLRES
jgi:hypothetical protein